jgi:hypothetical protein
MRGVDIEISVSELFCEAPCRSGSVFWVGQTGQSEQQVVTLGPIKFNKCPTLKQKQSSSRHL